VVPKYSALDAQGSVTASLIIQGDTWNAITVPLSFLVAQVATSLDPTSIAQGETGSMPITVKSIVGPDTHVLYGFDEGPLVTGFSMFPAQVFVPRGTTQKSSLVFQVPRNAPLGQFPLVQGPFITFSAFDGKQSGPLEPVPLTVTKGAISITFSNPAPIQLVQGSSAAVPVIVTIPLSASDFIGIDLVPVGLPTGVSMSAVSDAISWNPNGHPSLPPANVGPDGLKSTT
jgi:hypothetical protein